MSTIHMPQCGRQIRAGGGHLGDKRGVNEFSREGRTLNSLDVKEEGKRE